MVINLKPQSMGKTSWSNFHLNISGEINYNFLLLLKHSNKSPFPILEKSQKDLNPKDKEEWRNRVSLPQTSLGIIIPKGEQFIN